ncbi:MAG TPA: ATP F0F1 synthase subunit B [Methylocella sp.]|nr:ATP F0F1 synthase subunit B [Methylocella sp.]
MLDPEFIVAIGFAVFVGLMIYLGTHKKITAALDDRGKRIEAELAEAMRLRTEAEALLASFEKRGEEARKEADAVVAHAHAEAERIASEAHARIADFIERRTKQAEEKIRLAEAQAAADVRAAAADAAAKAAAIVLKGEVQGNFGDELIGKGIVDLKTQLQ